MTNSEYRPIRVLSLDLRTQIFGFVIFEGPDEILDWGVIECSNLQHVSVRRKFGQFQSLFRPSVIVIRTPDQSNRSVPHWTLKALTLFADENEIEVRMIDPSFLRKFFSKSIGLDKYDVAATVASRFPELSWRIARRRKPWQSELRRQSIFDAASVGIFYFDHQNTTIGKTC
jgi:PAS domain-containing protein